MSDAVAKTRNASTVRVFDSNGILVGTIDVENGRLFAGADSSTDIKRVIVTPIDTDHCVDTILFE